MNHPPYHLRTNKAVDRFLLVEMLQALSDCIDLSKYTYYGLGGPFLEDCRLLRDYCPLVKLVSLEQNYDTIKRQRFHKFANNLTLSYRSIKDFLSTYKSKGKEIIWLDYTDLTLARFDEFMQVLQNAESGTVVKITLRAQRDDNPHQMRQQLRKDIHNDLFDTFKSRFEREFREFLPGVLEDSRFRPKEFPCFLQEMLQVASEKALPANAGDRFQMLNSAYYNDGTWMLSVAGIICTNENLERIRKSVDKWSFGNIDWSPPIRIDVPVLSVKERLFLEKILPGNKNVEAQLAKRLGYAIATESEENLRKLQQYARFHRYYPYFARVSL